MIDLRHLLYIQRTRYKDEELLKSFERFVDSYEGENKIVNDDTRIKRDLMFTDLLFEIEFRDIKTE